MGEEEDPLSLQQKKNIALPIQVVTESNQRVKGGLMGPFRLKNENDVQLVGGELTFFAKGATF